MTKIYSCGEAAQALGVNRDKIQSVIRSGGPDASFRVGGKRVFTEGDIEALHRWLQAHDRNYKESGALKLASM